MNLANIVIHGKDEETKERHAKDLAELEMIVDSDVLLHYFPSYHIIVADKGKKIKKFYVSPPFEGKIEEDEKKGLIKRKSGKKYKSPLNILKNPENEIAGVEILNVELGEGSLCKVKPRVNASFYKLNNKITIYLPHGEFREISFKLDENFGKITNDPEKTYFDYKDKKFIILKP